MPVERRTVSASVRAASPSMSTSSYSQTPSWATVRRPAVTKRRDGAVGSPNSSGRPSAVNGRVTTVKAHSARDSPAGSGSGRCTRRRWSPLGFTKVVRDPHDGLVRPQLDLGVDLDPVLAHPRLRGAVDVVGPGVGGRDAHPGAHRAPLVDPHGDRLGRVDEGVLPGWRVVVRVPEVAAVDQPAVPGHARRGRRCRRRVDRHRHQAVGQLDRRRRLRTPRPGAPAGRAAKAAPAVARRPRRNGRRSSASTAGPWRPAPPSRAAPPAGCRRPAWPPRWARRASPRCRRRG